MQRREHSSYPLTAMQGILVLLSLKEWFSGAEGNEWFSGSENYTKNAVGYFLLALLLERMMRVAADWVSSLSLTAPSDLSKESNYILKKLNSITYTSPSELSRRAHRWTQNSSKNPTFFTKLPGLAWSIVKPVIPGIDYLTGTRPRKR